MHGHGYGDHDMGAGAWIGMGLGLIILTALVALVVVLLTRDRPAPAGGPAGPPARRETPQEVLQRRLAEGAITPDEYRTRLAALRGGEGPPGPA